jgi:hypothetical protein
LAASSPPILPLAPARLSTSTCWPQESESFCATMRVTMSVAPPGENGTMTRTDLTGKLCASAGVAPSSAAAANDDIVLRIDILLLV